MTKPTRLPGVLKLPEPIGRQPEMLDSPATRKVLRFGRRGGKTRFAFIAALAGHGPGWEDSKPKLGGILQGGDVVWICPTYSNLSTVLWREEIEPRMGHLPWIELRQTPNRDVTVKGLGTLMLRSGDRSAIDSIRGVGNRLAGVIVDEAAHLDLRGALLDVILPACIDNGAWLILMSTTNAGQDGGYDDTGAPQIPSYFNLICKQIQAGERGVEWVEFEGTAFDNPEMDRDAIEGLIAEYPPGSPKLDQEVYARLLETGVGLALPGLSAETHMVPAFTPPSYWHQWLGFDWGYHHPWALGRYCIDDDGQVYKRESLNGRLDLPEAIDAKVRKAGIDPGKVIVFAGPDVWRTRVSSKGKIQGEFTGPTVAEQLQGMGWQLKPAADARVSGLNNLRQYTYIDPAKEGAKPRFYWMDTPGNRLCLAQIARMPLDPDRPEDALKVDADAAGRGGDDWYDETRYALMSRPIVARQPVAEREQGQTAGFDFTNQRPRPKQTAEEEIALMLQRSQPNLIGARTYIPHRRGR